MDEDQPLVFLEMGQPPLSCSRSNPLKIPTAQILFKQIQYQSQAKKQLKIKQSQNNVYQKIKKALQRKLGHGRLMRGMSAKQQIRIKQMIETCNQRKHIRARNLSDQCFTSRMSSRNRNLSSKQGVKASISTCIEFKRPQTSRPSSSKMRTVRPQTSKQSCQVRFGYKNFQLNSQNVLKNSNNKTQCTSNIKLKKKNHRYSRQSSKIGSTKQNFAPDGSLFKKTTSTNLLCWQQNQSNFPYQQLNTAKQRKKKSKQILTNRFKSIIQNCDIQKQEIVCLGKKIGHFEYFCKKMTDKKSTIQKFCKRMQTKSDDSF